MKELALEIFTYNPTLIILLHVLSGVVWVGGMIAIRFAVHPAMQNIEDGKTRLARMLELLKNFFNIVTVFIVLLLITALIMSLAIDFAGSNLSYFVHLKELIWSVMTIIFMFIVKRRDRAERAFVSGDMNTAKTLLAPIAKYLIPINIGLGILAIAFGIVLRGF